MHRTGLCAQFSKIQPKAFYVLGISYVDLTFKILLNIFDPEIIPNQLE